MRRNLVDIVLHCTVEFPIAYSIGRDRQYVLRAIVDITVWRDGSPSLDLGSDNHRISFRV